MENQQPPGFLSEDLLREILYHASPKTLLKCAAVCKSWHSLIHSSSFISAHLSRRLQNPNNSLLLLFTEDRVFYQANYPDFGTPHFTHLSPLHFPDRGFFPFGLVGVTSCAGLVCVPDFWNFNLTLWNPSINKRRVVSFPVDGHQYLVIFGLGFDSRANDFKVLKVLCSPIDVWIYSLNSNSWVDISHLAPPGLSHYYPDAGFVLSGNGFLNCIGLVERRVHDDDMFRPKQFVNFTVVGFDCSANVFHQIPFPGCLRELALWDVTLSMMGFEESSLALVCGFVRRGLYDVWGLGVYGDANSWKKLFSIRDTVHEIRGWMFRKTDELLVQRMHPVGGVDGPSEDAEIVLYGVGAGIVACNPETKQANYLTNCPSKGCSYVGPFVESLVFLDAQKEDEDEDEGEEMRKRMRTRRRYF